jgi:hypothetical protein
MSDSTSLIDQITAGANAATRVNENLDAASPSMIYGRRAATTTGLTWGYFGGRLNSTAIANGVVSLTASSDNYVVAAKATGVVTTSTSTTNWSPVTPAAAATHLPLYKVTTGTSTVSSYEDHRQGIADVSTLYVPLASKDASGGYAGLTLFKINFKNALNTFTSFFTNSNTAARTYTFADRDGVIADDTDLAAKQSTSGKDATGGYAGLTLFKINFKNAANTITSFFTNVNTVARTYTFQDRDGTIADDTNLALKAEKVDVQVFPSSGTWTKPAGAKFVDAFLRGAYGGGGGGARVTAGTACSGGGAAGGPAFIYARYQASDLPSTVSIVVPAGGSAGVGATVDNTAGTDGIAGGVATFGDTLDFGLYAHGSGGGAGGQVAGNSGGGSSGGNGSLGVSGTSVAGGAAPSGGVAGGFGAGGSSTGSQYYGSGGAGGINGAAGLGSGNAIDGCTGCGSGGGISAGGAAFAGGGSGRMLHTNGSIAGVAAGAAGTAALVYKSGRVRGGLGGGSNAAGVGGAGGLGGGGGGSAIGGNGGAGGAGIDGAVVVITYF